MCDYSNEGELESILLPAIQKHGTPKYLVFSAGTYLRKSLLEYDTQTIQSVVGDNLLGVILSVKKLLPSMLKNGGGRIVFVGSQASVLGGTDPIYSSSKGGLVSFMKSITKGFSHRGVYCNCVSPGPIKNRMSTIMPPERIKYYLNQIPSGSFASPGEVVELICFLLLTESSSINGGTYDIDGGLVRR